MKNGTFISTDVCSRVVSGPRYYRLSHL